jgi:hypothetical protein
MMKRTTIRAVKRKDPYYDHRSLYLLLQRWLENVMVDSWKEALAMNLPQPDPYATVG